MLSCKGVNERVELLLHALPKSVSDDLRFYLSGIIQGSMLWAYGEGKKAEQQSNRIEATVIKYVPEYDDVPDDGA